MISKQAFDEYKKIFKQEFGQNITDEVAREQGERLIQLFKAIYKPIPKKQ